MSVGSPTISASGAATGSRLRIGLRSKRQKATTGAPIRSEPKLGKACAWRPSRKAASDSSSAAVTTPCPPRPWMRVWNTSRTFAAGGRGAIRPLPHRQGEKPRTSAPPAGATVQLVPPPERSPVTASAQLTQWVYDFQDGSRDLRDLLGGKGAGIAEMTRILGPDAVPPGFTITTEACVAVAAADGEDPPGLAEQIAKGMARLEERAGKRFGSAEDPLLVSVRSGARESMPGMMDTVLNLGLNDVSVRGLAERTGDAQFAWDSYRRLVQMFGNVVQGIPSEVFEDAIAETKRAAGARLDSELSVDDLRHLTAIFRDRYRADTGRDFPHDPAEQL